MVFWVETSYSTTSPFTVAVSAAVVFGRKQLTVNADGCVLKSVISGA